MKKTEAKKWVAKKVALLIREQLIGSPNYVSDLSTDDQSRVREVAEKIATEFDRRGVHRPRKKE